MKNRPKLVSRERKEHLHKYSRFSLEQWNNVNHNVQWIYSIPKRQDWNTSSTNEISLQKSVDELKDNEEMISQKESGDIHENRQKQQIRETNELSSRGTADNVHSVELPKKSAETPSPSANPSQSKVTEKKLGKLSLKSKLKSNPLFRYKFCVCLPIKQKYLITMDH